ncbi:type IX secretion system outer membrane channel protein PorV [Puteibacter caeruleilacunae]|nr:type IX secretion system outer membrane channel protein PorV [Puteibacter caeruleilacunae]
MKKKYLIATMIAVLVLGTMIGETKAQTSVSGANTITTAVSFLTIAPDSRAGAMGDVGVATTPDMNSQHWNPAKYAFMESTAGAAISYTPWLRKLVSDMSISYLVGYKQLDDQQTISGSLRYFALGDIIFRESADAPAVPVSPNEFAVDFGYTRLLSDNFSGSVVLRYIRSDIFSGQAVQGMPTKAGNSIAADVAFFYTNSFKSNRKLQTVSAGIDISNIGSKISYESGKKDFIPTNMRLGGSYSVEMDRYNKFSFALDLNKLLVPTPEQKFTGEGEDVVVTYDLGEDDSVISGIFKSFGDAPGGASEELKEITASIGGEYVYNNQFFVRAGYFYEHESKGNRKYVTAGAGLKMNVFALDFAYLVPTVGNSPLENTLRFSLSFDLDELGGKKKRRRR